MSRSPPTARCRPARRRSPQGRARATGDEHGLCFYGFLRETMDCGVRAAASYIPCRYQSLSQRGLSCRMLLCLCLCHVNDETVVIIMSRNDDDGYLQIESLSSLILRNAVCAVRVKNVTVIVQFTATRRSAVVDDRRAQRVEMETRCWCLVHRTRRRR